MPTAMQDPTPSWLKPENASVLDSQLVKILRAIVNANPWPKPLQGVLPNPNPAAMALHPQDQILALMGADVPSGGPRIEGWHGSPANFDKFDFKYIGTGEGAQAYGHGGYIAGHEGTGKYYRDALSKGFEYQGQPIDPRSSLGRDLDFITSDVRSGESMTTLLPRRIKELRDHAAFMRKAEPGYGSDAMYDRAADALAKLDPAHLKTSGKLYQVAIHADPEHLLDWDKPLHEQSPHVQQALEQLGVSPKPVQPWHAHQITAEDVAKKLVPANYAPGSWISAVRDPAGQIKWHGGQLFGSEAAAAENAAVRTAIDQRAMRDKGRELYQDLGAPTKKEASQKLEKAGIPGIKYLDQGSRGQGEGSYNYVVFDENRLEILKKLGLLLPAIGTGAASYGGPFQQSQEAK